MTNPTLSHCEATAFYDRFGAKQDKQGWYEDAAINVLVEHGDFQFAQAICEFGCGTGKLAERLLTTPGAAIDHYLALDSSSVMTGLAVKRLRQQASAKVQLTNGEIKVPTPAQSFERMVSCYVVDLLSEHDTKTFLEEAQRVLKPGGLLCVASLCGGIGTISKLVSSTWGLVHKINPSVVGGCRPISFATTLDSEVWDIRHREIVTPWSVPSEIVIAVRRQKSD